MSARATNKTTKGEAAPKLGADDAIVLGATRATFEALPSSAGQPHLVDAGNAQRFARRHGDDVRYCYAWKSWLVWDGRRWHRDPGAVVMRFAKETARAIYDEAASEPDDDRRRSVARWAVTSESVSRLRAMLDLAQSERGIDVDVETLDRDPFVLNVVNGTLDLRTGTLREHARADVITRLAPVAYDPAAECPLWLAFLGRIFDGDDDVIDFVQRAVGYSLTGATDEQCFFVAWGTGANGKSTMLNTLGALLGDYACGTRPETFMVKDRDAISNDVARLRGARLVTAVELDEGRRLGESFVKQLTGGETLTARFLYSEHFEFAPAFKLWLGTNHKPTIRGTDHAIWRRVRLIPFAVTIPEGERDRRLGEKLRAEWPGILRWALDGCRAWQRDGLGEPEEVRAATAEYRAEQDTVGQFIADTCVIEADAAEPVDTIYTVYEAWCDDAGVRFRLTKQQLGDKLTERDGIQRGRLGKQRTRVFLGIRRRRSDDLVQGESRDGADAADAADSSSANLSYRVPTRKETGNARPLLSAVRRKRP